jgi:hypothetical protein
MLFAPPTEPLLFTNGFIAKRWILFVFIVGGRTDLIGMEVAHPAKINIKTICNMINAFEAVILLKNV